MDARREHVRSFIASVFWLAVAAAAAAQQVASIPPGDASLAGRIIDVDSHRPLEGALLTLTTFDRKAVLKSISDAEGYYSFEGISPSGYFLSVFVDGYGSHEYSASGTRAAGPAGVLVAPGRRTTGVNFRLRRAGTVAGQVTLFGGSPARDALVAVVRTSEDTSVLAASPAPSRTDSRGSYSIPNVPAGSYRVLASWADPEALEAGVKTAMQLTYFPGTESLAEASAIRVDAGETVRGINIHLIPKEFFRISGHVLRGPSENAIEANLVSTGWSVRTIEVADDGAFEIAHLPPDRYTFWARARTVDAHEAAVISVDLGSDMTGLTMPLLPTGGVSGRVVTDDGATLPGGLQVSAVQADQGKQIDSLDRDRAGVVEDGRFELRGLFGERILRVLGLAPEWKVDRVLHGASPVESLSIISGKQTDNVTIVLKRR
jgi:hypothetical protein